MLSLQDRCVQAQRQPPSMRPLPTPGFILNDSQLPTVVLFRLQSSMESPHQAFLLARVRPHGTLPGSPGRYRCIGALYIRSDCKGVIPLQAVRRFINLISQKGNASVVRSELRAIDGQYGHAVDELPKIPDFPCPFAHSLFRAAWSINVGKNRYVNPVQLLPASTRCWRDVCKTSSGLIPVDTVYWLIWPFDVQ